MAESIVFTKVVLVDGDTFCFCDKEFSKTCSIREINELNCKESIIRIVSVDRDMIEEDTDARIRLLENSVGKLNKSFNKTLKHLNRIR